MVMNAEWGALLQGKLELWTVCGVVQFHLLLFLDLGSLIHPMLPVSLAETLNDIAPFCLSLPLANASKRFPKLWNISYEMRLKECGLINNTRNQKIERRSD